MSKITKIGIVVLVVALIGWWWQSSQLPITNSMKTKPVDKISSDDRFIGNPNAPIRVIEFSDFQCPACKEYSGVDEQLAKEFGNTIGVAYRYFPLQEIHQNATLAAQAGEAAALQGKFWQLSQVLFDKQDDWDTSGQPLQLFVSYAQSVGIDTNKFIHDIDAKSVQATVQADYLDGLLYHVDATPTFFVNGQMMNNLQGPDDLISRIELAMQDATASGLKK